QPDLVPLPPDHWAAVQEKLIAEERWILDGDLGPYDVVEPRFSAADTIIVLDFSLVRCVWQAFQRSRERAGFWQWVWMYRRRYRPILMQAIAKNAQNAQLLILPSPKAVRRLLANIARAAV
ncbi:MAG TPA: adenylate kinase, partial [Candidatus Angelobacter sp.]